MSKMCKAGARAVLHCLWLQVIQQLERPQANMAHCKLGYDGAKALGAALSAASNIVALDLRDNGLDGKVSMMGVCR